MDNGHGRSDGIDADLENNDDEEDAHDNASDLGDNNDLGETFADDVCAQISPSRAGMDRKAARYSYRATPYSGGRSVGTSPKRVRMRAGN